MLTHAALRPAPLAVLSQLERLRLYHCVLLASEQVGLLVRCKETSSVGDLLAHSSSVKRTACTHLTGPQQHNATVGACDWQL